MIFRFQQRHRTIGLDPIFAALWRETLDYFKASQAKEINAALEPGVAKLEDLANQGDKDNAH